MDISFRGNLNPIFPNNFLNKKIDSQNWNGPRASIVNFGVQKCQKNEGQNQFVMVLVPNSFPEILKNWTSAHAICSLLRGRINQTGIKPNKRQPFLFYFFVEGQGIFEIRNRVTVATLALSCDGHVQTKLEGGCEWSR